MKTKTPTAFALGRQYRCPAKEGREAFNFVVIGKSDQANHKLCFLRVSPEDRLPGGRYSANPTTSCYSHNHLKKFGSPLDEIVDPLAFEVEGQKYRLELEVLGGYGKYKVTLWEAVTDPIEGSAQAYEFKATGDITLFYEKNSWGQSKELARLSSGPDRVISRPEVPYGKPTFDLEVYAWKAWASDVLGTEVHLPFFED